MAVTTGLTPITEFADWYDRYEVNESTGCLRAIAVGKQGAFLWHQFEKFKREVDARLERYVTLEKLADGQVIHEKPDLPNISSGETAGLVRRIARSLVQNTPNVEVISLFDDDSVAGIFSRHVLTTKIIGSDQYSNDMQQNLFASTKTAITLGFDTVIPALVQDPANGWHIKYDTIHYRDVFPEPGAKDVREATNVFIRRYLTKGEVQNLCRYKAPGWDHTALYTMLENDPPNRQMQSIAHQDKKHATIPDGYEIITWYSNSGDAFLTFDANTKMLLRIEKNKHPLNEHPVFFLVLEKDSLQPYGKSQVELLIGRQDFQDLMLNGAMKLWYRNINPSIIGYGAVNAVPNLSPGKYTSIPNPNAKIEAFEVNTQTLMQFGQISEQNLGNMVNLIGAPDQQMAQSAGNGMSATPQGVEAQQTMVDLTTNNYQKAIEGFFSHYCSYALTIFFQELKMVDNVVPTAEARIRLIKAGLKPYEAEVDDDGKAIIDAETGEETNVGHFNKDGSLSINFKDLATEYWVRCVPGSLVELEDEKQLRILNQMFIPLSQAMPALAAVQDPTMLQNAARAMQYIIQKEIELSGSSQAMQISTLFQGGDEAQVRETDQRLAAMEQALAGQHTNNDGELQLTHEAVKQLQEQVRLLTENQKLLTEQMGGQTEPSGTSSAETEAVV